MSQFATTQMFEQFIQKEVKEMNVILNSGEYFPRTRSLSFSLFFLGKRGERERRGGERERREGEESEEREKERERREIEEKREERRIFFLLLNKNEKGLRIIFFRRKERKMS